MQKWVVLKNNVKIYIKIYIKTILTAVTLASTNNALPDDGVTALKHVGAVLMLVWLHRNMSEMF
jgi:hypothetical protein